MAPRRKTNVSQPEEEASEYEKVRRQRIEANRARLSELGLEKLAKKMKVQHENKTPTMRAISSAPPRRSDRLRGTKLKSVEEGSDEDGSDDEDSDEEMIVSKKQLEYNNENEDEYFPAADAMEQSDSGSESTYMSDEDDLPPTQAEKAGKGKEKVIDASLAELDEDELNLQQALALSLEPAAASSKRTEKPVNQSNMNKRMTGKMKFNSSEAEINTLYHTIAGTGRGLSLADLERAATAHNFAWSKQELEEMIYLFDKDKDGRLSLDEFRSVATRCRVLETTPPLR